MRLKSQVSRSLVVSLVCLGAVYAADGGVLEVDIVFPRNDTYTPTDAFPVIFAFQNADLARYLNMGISYTIRNRSNLLGDNVHFSHELRWANWSSHDPYFKGRFFEKPFTVEGQWRLTWEIFWHGCLPIDDSLDGTWSDPTRSGIISNTSIWSVDFTISNDGQAVDLVAATANNETCPEELGITIKVPGKTKKVSESHWSGGDTCAVLDISSPTATPNPCAVKIDSATAASISASWAAVLCNGVTPPATCPPRGHSSSQQLVVAGVASLAAAFGAFGFLWM